MTRVEHCFAGARSVSREEGAPKSYVTQTTMKHIDWFFLIVQGITGTGSLLCTVNEGRVIER